MPEGDSIHRLAIRLAPLIGKEVRALSSHVLADAVAATLVGRTIVAVEAHGKNLLVRFDDGRSLHVHLRMLGRLGIERPRSSFWKPRRTTPQIRLEVDGLVVIGDKIPVLRVLPAGVVPHELSTLGPDLLREPDLDRCVAGLVALGDRPIGEALLVQRALAGIGNIFKSETLFVAELDPRTAVRALSDERLRQLVRTAGDLLRRNVRPGARATRTSLSGPRLWVYRRDGRPCLRCHDATILRILQGRSPGRSTYFCPRCQRSPS